MKHARVAFDGRIHDVHAETEAPEGMLRLAGDRRADEQVVWLPPVEVRSLMANAKLGRSTVGVKMDKPYYVHAAWDDEARVWVASSEDVPGLATEAETTEALIEKLKILIPELLELNGYSIVNPIAFELLMRRFEIAA